MLGHVGTMDVVTETGRKFAEVSGEMQEVIVASTETMKAMPGLVDGGVYLIGSGDTGLSVLIFLFLFLLLFLLLLLFCFFDLSRIAPPEARIFISSRDGGIGITGLQRTSRQEVGIGHAALRIQTRTAPVVVAVALTIHCWCDATIPQVVHLSHAQCNVHCGHDDGCIGSENTLRSYWFG